MNEYILKVLNIFGLDNKIFDNGYVKNKGEIFEVKKSSDEFCLNSFLSDEISSVHLKFKNDLLDEITIMNRLILSKGREIEYTFMINKEDFIDVYINQHFSNTKFQLHHLKYNPNKLESKNTVLLFDRGDNMGLADSFNITYNPQDDSYITCRQKRRTDYKEKYYKQVRKTFGTDGEIMTRGIFNSIVIQDILWECMISMKNLNEDLWEFCENEFPLLKDYTKSNKVLIK